MRLWALTVLAVLVGLAALARGQDSVECAAACGLEDYVTTLWTLAFSDGVCSHVIDTLNCFDNNPSCDPQDHAIYSDIQFDFLEHGCGFPPLSTPSEMETTSPQPPPDPPLQCSQGYFRQGFRGSNLEAPAVQPELSTQECTMTDPRELQHCSLYALSNLRSFDGYRTGIENCRIPGWWYLIENSHFSIAVEGVNEDLQHPHTKLAKINVTIHPHPCSEGKSYTADHTLPLPDTFADGSQPASPNSPLQLRSSPSSELTIILATWINTTIVIRHHSGFLSVTVQVPGGIGFESEGLCRGCPSHSYHNITTVREHMISDCPAVFSNVSIVCFTESALVNQFGDIHNNTYSEGCVFDVLMADTANVGMLLLHRAVGNDAKLLPSIGNVPPRPWPIQPPPPPEATPTTATPTSATTEEVLSTGSASIVLIHSGSLELISSGLLSALLTSVALILLLR